MGSDFEHDAHFWKDARSRVKKGECDFSNWDFPDDPAKKWFSDTTFSKEANFENASFCHAIFKKAKFKDSACFDGITVKEYADFVGVIFDENADFVQAEFLNDVFFIKTTFKKMAIFRAARFRGELHFEKANFSEAVDFNSAIADRPITLPDSSSITKIEGISSAFRLAKTAAHLSGNHEQESEFHFYERRSLNQNRRKTSKKGCDKIMAWIELFFGDFLFGYGERVRGVIIAMILVIAGFTFLYLSLGFNTQNSTGTTVIIRGHYVDSLYFSLVTFTTLGYGDIKPLESYRIFSGIEAFLGVFFISSFLVILSRKFIR